MPSLLCRKLTLSRTSLVILALTIVVGDFVSFYKISLTWKIPDREENSLCLLAISDPQIQGYNDELPSILGYITRWDSDRYLRHAFSLAVNFVKPDVVVFLGDLFDEGFQATDEEFFEYKQRFDRIFNEPSSSIHKIYLAGDNDVGGEGPDLLTPHKVERFTEFFGPINDIINFKSFQLIKINTVSFLRFSEPAYVEEKSTYNDTLQFIHGISSHVKSDTSAIVLAHAPLPNMPSNLYQEFISKTNPKVSLAGHLHKHLQVYHRIKKPAITFWEYVIPTCSYRMGTKQIGIGILTVENNAKPKLSILKLPDRYYYLHIYLIMSCVTLFIVIISSRIIRKLLMSLVWTIFCPPKEAFKKNLPRKIL